MREAYVLGVGMTRFGKHLERTMKDLAREAVEETLRDAGITRDAPQAAFVGNAAQGLISGQECVRGQVVLREQGIGGIPIINVENACASASTALHLAWQAVAGGIHDCVLALGMEKLYHRLMCSPIGDGAAAAVVVSPEYLVHLRLRGTEVPRPLAIHVLTV